MYLPKSNCFKPAMLLVCTLLITVLLHAQGIKGTVTDVNTGDPLLGATVLLKESGKKLFVPLDGNFYFKNVPPGKYELEISYVNYKSRTETVIVNSGVTSHMKVTLEPKITELYSVIVTGGSNSDRNIRALERNSNQLVNVVSAKNIELLPDITVANVMQRVSGVTVEKNSAGEARYPIIRGMEKRYINTLVNGIKIPSPDNKSRFIPLDLFPTELLERLEVSKSLTPSMEGDAIGGTINLVMKDAPATKLIQANVSMGYNNIFQQQPFSRFAHMGINKKSPSEINGRDYTASPGDFPVSNLMYSSINNPMNTAVGLTVGNRFGKDKKLGILVSGSYQNIFSGTQSTFFLPNAQPGLDNIPQFIDLYSRQYSTQNQRLGLNSKFDYRVNEHNKISWFNTYVLLNMYQTRQQSDTVALNSLVDESFRSTWQYQSIYNSTLQGLHQLAPSWLLDWSAGYSIANNHMPDQAQFTHEFPVLVSAGDGKVTRGTPDILSSMSSLWLHNSDKDLSAYINLTKQLQLLNRPFELKFGGLIRDKKRDNFYNSYSLNPLLPAGSSVQTYTDIEDAQFTFKGANATAALNGNNYTFNEDIAAGYVQGKWLLFSRVEALGGVRVENTHQKYNTELGPEVDARSGKITYTDVLPSAQVKFIIDKLQLLRFSYYKALARPQFAELIPDGPDNYETFKEKGNPTSLNHSLADNYDIRYERANGNSNQILLGVFYKRIKDPIEYTAVKTGVTSQNLIPTNIGTATNYGFEAVFTKYFGPFGISANYTYTQSRVTNDSMLYSYRNEAGVRTSKYISETRPLQGQANHVANVSLIFKSHRMGLDAQLAFVYTGERISLVSPYAGLHYWQQPYKGLDFSFEQRLAKRVTVYGKLNNLTNSPTIGSLHIPYNTYIASSGSRPLSLQTESDKQIIVQKDYVRTSFLFGLRFKF